MGGREGGREGGGREGWGAQSITSSTRPTCKHVSSCHIAAARLIYVWGIPVIFSRAAFLAEQSAAT